VRLVGRKNRGRLAPLGGVERPRRVVRFARLIQRRVRAFGRPLAGAAFAGNLNLTRLPLSVARSASLRTPDRTLDSDHVTQLGRRGDHPDPARTGGQHTLEVPQRVA
jgi:hypothetical protein